MADRSSVAAADVALAGRERELAVSLERLEAALRGEPQILILLGEPGIGKTTLARAGLDVAARRGAATAIGVALDDAAAPPYWPWRQVLRSLARDAGIAEIAKAEGLAKDLGAIAPDVFGPPREAEADRFAHFDAVAELLRAASQNGPLALQFDDVQWADGNTLLLLRHLSRVLSGERVLITLTARDTEPEPAEQVGELAGGRIVTTLKLAGLDAGGVRAQLAALVGRSLDPDEVGDVVRLTGGNPLLVREVGRQLEGGPLQPGDDAVTPSIRALVERRLRGLGDGGVALLEAAALLGLEFRAELAGGMLGESNAAALDLLDRLRAAGLVEPAEASTWRFPHALIREAVAARIGASRRLALHRAAAEELERLGLSEAGGRFELARHWVVAAPADRPRATAAITAAADEAMHRLAFESASTLYRQALEAGAGALPEEARCRLWLRAAGADERAADHRGRFEACQQAAQLARRLGRPDLLAQVALALSPNGPIPRVHACRQACEEALEGIDADDLATRARLTAQHAETYLYTHDLNRFEPQTRAALDMAEQSGDPEALAAALRIRQFVLGGPAHLEDRADLAARMLEQGRRLKLPMLKLQGHLGQVDVELERGNLAAAAAEVDAVGSAGAALRLRFVRFLELQARAVLALGAGRFDECRGHIDAAFVTFGAGGDRNPYFMRSAVLANMSRHTGVDVETLRALQEALLTDGERAGLIGRVSDARVYAQAGRLDEARLLYESCGPVESWRPPPHVELLVAALGIGAAVYLGRVDDALALREWLLPYREHHVVCGTGAITYVGPVELWTGMAARIGGLLNEAVGELESAAERARAAGAQAFEADAEIELAAALARRGEAGDLARARKLLAAASRTAASLGANALRERAAALERELGRDSRRLTRREEEIARLVAQGLSNRVIAERLFLSERTVQNHVQHLLDKLNLANRTQIATWAQAELSSQSE